MTTTVTVQTGGQAAIITHACAGNGVSTERVEPHSTKTVHAWQGKGLTIVEETTVPMGDIGAETRGIGVNGGVLPEAQATQVAIGAQQIDRNAIGQSLQEADDYSAANMPIGAQRVSLHVLREQITGIEIIRPAQSPTLTIAVLTTRNGFHLVGKSACADPKAYDREKGERFAVDDALRQLWPLHAYLLRQQLNDQEKAA